MTIDRTAGLARLFAGPFPALEGRLLARLPRLLAAPPGVERILLVPSNALREHLLRRFAGAWEGAAAFTEIGTLYDFALRLLKHRGLFPRELPPALLQAALQAAVRESYAGGEGDFAAIAGTAGFLSALARTLEDLEEGWIGPEAFHEAARHAAAAGEGARAARMEEWRRLLSAVERKIHALGGMTRRRIFQEAVAGFEQPGYPFRVTLYGFYDFTRLQWLLADALLSSGILEEVYFPGIFRPDGTLSPAFAYAARTWDRVLRAFEGNAEHLPDEDSGDVRALRNALFAPPGAAASAAPSAPLTILSPPHEEGEARLAARLARRVAEGTPERDVLVVSRNMSPATAEAWDRAAREYDLPTAGRAAAALSGVPPVRVLLRALRAAAGDFPRRDVVEVLSSPYYRTDAEGAARPDLWEVISREAFVLGGDDWEARLSRLPVRRRTEGEGTDGPETREREAQGALLRAEVRSLRRAMAPVLSAVSRGELAAAIRAFLSDRFRVFEDGSSAARRDRDAMRALLSLLDDLARIPGSLVPWPGFPGALDALASLLDGTRIFTGEKGGMRVPGAVVAGDLHPLRGVTADHVVVLSVNDDAVPATVDEDPLLPDDDRAAINRVTRQASLPDALSLIRRNASEERLLFALPALQARTALAVSVPRADAAGNARRPSRFLLHLLSQFAGPSVFSGDWARASGAGIVSLPRPPFAALGAEGPLSGREKALRAWREGGAAVPEGADVPWHRVAAVLSSLAGRVSGAGLFPEGPGCVRKGGAFSATELDLLATCPYRFFLGHRVGLLPVEDPEEESVLAPADLGRIVHDLLRRLGTDAVRGLGWGDAGAAAQKAFARFARENPTGLPGLFRIQCREIVRDAEALLAHERAKQVSDPGWRVAAVEEPFRTEGADGAPAFRGRIDRLDRGPRGEAIVVDYKYRDGKGERIPLRRMEHGLANQIPVYLTFAESLDPPDRPVRATLVFLKKGVREVTVDGAQWDAVRRSWADALSGWLALDAGGPWPPLPHHLFSYAGEAPPRYCDACPFGDHCRVAPAVEGNRREEEALLRRVETAPALAAVRAHRPARA